MDKQIYRRNIHCEVISSFKLVNKRRARIGLRASSHQARSAMSGIPRPWSYVGAEVILTEQSANATTSKPYTTVGVAFHCVFLR